MTVPLEYGLGAVGLWLLLVPPPPPALRRLLAGPPEAEGDPADLVERLGGWVRRFEWGDWLRRRAASEDLDVVGRSMDAQLGAKVALGVLGVAGPVIAAGILGAAGVHVTLAVPAWFSLLLGAVGFFVPDIQRSRAAASARQELRSAVEDFAEITAYGLRSGSNVATALDGAARRLRGRFGDEVSRVLTEALLVGGSPWLALDELGTRLALPDLREVAAAVQQAETGGASIVDSLEAKASGLAQRALAEREAASVPGTLRMLVRSIGLALCALALLYGPLLMRARRL